MTVLDNDEGIRLSTTRVEVQQGVSGAYTVQLQARPTGDVTVTVAQAPGGNPDVTFDTDGSGGTTLTFTTANWSTPQSVTVLAPTDSNPDTVTATLTHSATGGGYAGRTASLTVSVTYRGPALAYHGTAAAMNGATLTLQYNKGLDPNSVPAAGAFAVAGVGCRQDGHERGRQRRVRNADPGLGGNGERHGGDGELHAARDQPHPGRGREEGRRLRPAGCETTRRPASWLWVTKLTAGRGRRYGRPISLTAQRNLEPSGDVIVTIARATGGSEDVTVDTSPDPGVQNMLTFTRGELQGSGADGDGARGHGRRRGRRRPRR